jgi:hypothetical protein
VDPELLLLLPPSTLPLPREPSDGGGTVVDPELLLLLPLPVGLLPSTSPLKGAPFGYGGALFQLTTPSVTHPSAASEQGVVHLLQGYRPGVPSYA